MSNVPITYGSGQASVATETISNNDYQKVKIVDGTAGSTNAWKVDGDGAARVSIMGTVPITGSVVALTTGNQSVSGTVGASVIGWVPAQLSNTSVITVWQDSSVIAVVSGNQSISGTVGASVIGTVPTTQSGTRITSISGTVGTSIIGTVPVTQTTNPWCFGS